MSLNTLNIFEIYLVFNGRRTATLRGMQPQLPRQKAVPRSSGRRRRRRLEPGTRTLQGDPG